MLLLLCCNEHWSGVSFQIIVFSRDMPQSGIAESYLTMFFVLKGTSILFSIVIVPIYIAINSIESSLSSTPSLALILTRMRWHRIVVLICSSLVITDIEHLSCAFWPSVCLLWRNVCLHLLPVFWLACYFDIELHGCLYNLEINPLLVALFVNIFSHSEVCLSFCLWFPLLCKSF